MNKYVKRVLKILGITVGSIIAIVLIFVLVLTIAEYRPDDVEWLELTGSSDQGLAKGQTFTILSWNMGYGGLGETSDFFMDGGKGVRTQNEDQVRANVQAVIDMVEEVKPDVVFLQEIDRNSTRSWHMDQVEMVGNALSNYQGAFAANFKVLFMPFPIPPYGHIDSGIMTLSRYEATSAERIKLPCPFSWPMRLLQLKRCLLVERIPIEDSDKELVLINLHLEAYDDGEGKLEQARMLEEMMQAERDKGNYVIAGGDFNQTFSSVDTSMYPIQNHGDDVWMCGEMDTGIFNSSWQFCMDTTWPTCRSLDRPYDRNDEIFQFFMIDGFIVSDNLMVESMETINEDFVHSDHNPVRITLTIPEL